MNKLNRTFAVAATLALGIGSLATAARADVIRVISSPAVLPVQRTLVVPSTRIYPGFTTTTTRRTFMPAPPATVTTRTYSLPAVIDDVTPSTVVAPSTVVTPADTTVITPANVVVPTGTVTSTSTVTETKVAEPDPMGRLNAMGQQIDLGLSKGLLNTATASSLRAEFSRLQILINADLADGLSAAENNDLERQLTVFQQQISNAMK